MTSALTPVPARHLPVALWRDPKTVPPDQRLAVIQRLETAVELNPDSCDLRTCLGIAYAVNYDVYKSLDQLELATKLDPSHFYAQVKLAELWYRLRALPRAEEETQKALQMAGNQHEYEVARTQLKEIRRLINKGYARPSWEKPFAHPKLAMAFFALFVVASAFMVYR